MEVKTCALCEKELSLDNFPIREWRKDGTPSRRKYCRECWNAIRRGFSRNNEDPSFKNTSGDDFLLNAILQVTHYDIDALEILTKEDFLHSITYNDTFSFTELKKRAFEYLDSIGVGTPAEIELHEDGNYLVIGDTFGQNSRTGMFRLINNVISNLNVKAVVAIGRQLDDSGTVSNCFSNINVPIIFVATSDELKDLHKLFKDSAKICRKAVRIGDVCVRNQEAISTSVKVPISTLDPIVFSGNCVVNCVRQEFATRFSNKRGHWIASPGTLAEPHVRRLVNRLTFTDGVKVKQVYAKNFSKYRRMEENLPFQEQGFLILSKRNSSVLPVNARVKIVDGEYTTALYGKVYSETSCRKAACSAVLADLHYPYVNTCALQSVLKYLKEKKWDTLCICGDLLDMASMNHHVLSRGELPDTNVLDDLKGLATVLNAFDYVTARDKKYITGNHCVFSDKLLNKSAYTQFKSLFYAVFDFIVDDYEWNIMEADYYWWCGNTAILHGHADVGVQGSSNTEKVARGFGEAIIGHSHSTNLRFGTLRVGRLCDDMMYAGCFTRWDYSIGVITHVNDDTDFINYMLIDDEHEYRITDLFEDWYADIGWELDKLDHVNIII